MTKAQLRVVGRLYGVPDAIRNDPVRCARALVRIWTDRGLSPVEAAKDAEIAPQTARAIYKQAGAEVKYVVTFREPETSNA